MGVFDLNNKMNITTENFLDSNIYYIDNFFENPDDICNVLSKHKPQLFETYHHPMIKNMNGEHFYDMRNELKRDDVTHIYDFLEELCGHTSHFKSKDVIRTNLMLLKKCDFNKDYKTHYWHPHLDLGYTAIVYLNKNDETCGTNIYEKIASDPYDWCGEHAHPWSPRKYWKLLKSLKPKYNRCVLFNGKNFFHGMDISNEMYFKDEFRRNLAFFLKPF